MATPLGRTKEKADITSETDIPALDIAMQIRQSTVAEECSTRSGREYQQPRKAWNSTLSSRPVSKYQDLLNQELVVTF